MNSTRDGYDAVTKVRNVAVSFNNSQLSCEKLPSCYFFGATLLPYGLRVKGPRECTVHQGGGTSGSWVECPAKGAAAFHMSRGGTWFGYLFGNGKHADGPCARDKITVFASGAPNVTTTIQAWDGCRETIVCAKTRSAISNVQADRFDVIRGRCTSVTRK